MPRGMCQAAVAAGRDHRAKRDLGMELARLAAPRCERLADVTTLRLHVCSLSDVVDEQSVDYR